MNGARCEADKINRDSGARPRKSNRDSGARPRKSKLNDGKEHVARGEVQRLPAHYSLRITNSTALEGQKSISSKRQDWFYSGGRGLSIPAWTLTGTRI